MKPKRVKTKNTHLFAVRLPLPLVKRVNEARINQGVQWAPLLANLFERYLAERALADEKANVETCGAGGAGGGWGNQAKLIIPSITTKKVNK